MVKNLTQSLLFILLAAGICPALGQQGSILFPFNSPTSGKIGYIDKTGKIVIEPRFDKDRRWWLTRHYFEPARFSEGLAPAAIDKRYGYIDETGEFVINPTFEFASPFSNGRGKVQDPNTLEYGYVDRKGQLVIKAKYEDARDFSEGLAAVRLKYKFGFIDLQGKEVIHAQFDKADNFSEGLALVHVNNDTFFIDKQGKAVLRSSDLGGDVFFEGSFSEGLAYFCRWRDLRCGFINQRGNVVIPPRFSHRFSTVRFSEGLAAVEIRGRLGYIDKNGQVVIQPRFEDAHDFSEGRALVEILNPSGRDYGYIDRAGTLVTRGYESGSQFFDGVALVFEKRRSDRRQRPRDSYRKFSHFSYITHKGDVIFRSAIPLDIYPCENCASSTVGEPPLVDVHVESIPKGAKLYLIPFLEWDDDQNFINTESKMLMYLQGGETPFSDKIYQDVYILVLQLNGKRLWIKKDFNEFQGRKVSIRF